MDFTYMNEKRVDIYLIFFCCVAKMTNDFNIFWKYFKTKADIFSVTVLSAKNGPQKSQ